MRWRMSLSANRWPLRRDMRALAAATPSLALAGVRIGRRDRRCGARLVHRHLDAVAQLVGAVDHHALAGLEPALDRDALAVDRAELDLAHRDRVVVADHVDEGARRAALDRAGRHHLGVAQ